MTTPFIYHGQDAFWVQPTAQTLQLVLTTEFDHPFDQLFVRCEPDNEEQLVPMNKISVKNRLQYWQAEIPLSGDKNITAYCFKALTDQRQWWLSGTGLTQRMPGQEKHFKYNRIHQPPQWVRQQVFYQIFPDRFANGDPKISVTDDEYCLQGDQRPTIAKEWGTPVSDHGKNGPNEFYGGDLKGVQDKLDYLQGLGISALYLNPIFAAPSNHKYDTRDYLNIDPHLGTNEQFAGMVADLHQRGMKIMLDAVYNHTSVDHHWFDKYQKNGADQPVGAFGHPDSPYRHYYQFDGESDQYVGWNGISTLPKLNFSNPEVQDYIYAGEDAVIKHWLRPPYGIDAWRFDVIHMLGEGAGAKHNAHYVKAFRDSAKSVNPDCYVLGEHFFEATSWLQGDQEDGAMNYYGFGHPVRAFFAQKDIAYHPCRIDAAELRVWLDEARAKTPWLNQLSQLNQLDSHDTMRFLTMVDEDRDTIHLGLVLLFAYIGTPCIYYGTEVGLPGGMDPDNRRCFPWNGSEPDHPTWQLIQKLATARQSSKVLQEGSIQWLYAQDQQLVFARTFENEIWLCAINNSDRTVEITLPVWQVGLNSEKLTDLITKKFFLLDQHNPKLCLAPKQGLLLC